MKKGYRDYFSTTYNGFEKTLKGQTTTKPVELSFEEQMKQADEFVKNEKARKRQQRIATEDKVKFGNPDYETYRANKTLIDEKAKNKGKR